MYLPRSHPLNTRKKKNASERCQGTRNRTGALPKKTIGKEHTPGDCCGGGCCPALRLPIPCISIQVGEPTYPERSAPPRGIIGPTEPSVACCTKRCPSPWSAPPCDPPVGHRTGVPTTRSRCSDLRPADGQRNLVLGTPIRLRRP